MQAQPPHGRKCARSTPARCSAGFAGCRCRGKRPPHRRRTHFLILMRMGCHACHAPAASAAGHTWLIGTRPPSAAHEQQADDFPGKRPRRHTGYIMASDGIDAADASMPFPQAQVEATAQDDIGMAPDGRMRSSQPPRPRRPYRHGVRDHSMPQILFIFSALISCVIGRFFTSARPKAEKMAVRIAGDGRCGFSSTAMRI